MSLEKPKMYQKTIHKKFDNTQEVYSSMYEKNYIYSDKKFKLNSNFTIEQKIINIFKSPTYVYKIDVIIEMDDGNIEKRIVGKNKNCLITIDNEYIPIDKIRDIYLK